MYRVELKENNFLTHHLMHTYQFLMYRVELKAKNRPNHAQEPPMSVPNVPCGVESY